LAKDVLNFATGLPNGARFYRCALQVNPHHYTGTFRGAPAGGDAASHANAIAEKAVELGISVLAITDHNDVSGVPAFRAAAAGRGICIFPGFELSSSEGVHILCIYPRDTDDDKLGRFLGEFGITEIRPSTEPANKSFVEILEKVRKQGGVTVAAHVTNSGGLFDVLSGQPRIKAWQHDDLRAIQIPGPISDLPHDVRQIVENQNPDYRRSNNVGDGLAIAVVNAKDVTKPDDLADHSATCWIKMSDVSIEGLKQAFLDPGSRIRLNPKTGRIEPNEHAEIVAVTWEGGFLDGAAVHFNPNLNVLVGGRGTGKSTIVESIRSVMAIEPVGEEARTGHEGIVRHVLKNGTKISLLVRAHRPNICEYRIERTIPNPPVVRDSQGNVSSLTPHDVLPSVEIYGQHEISELTKSREKLTRLLDRFVEPSESLQQKKSDLKRELEKNRRGLVDARGELQQIDDRLAALPGLEETLQRFREAGLEERLKEQSLLVREERVLTSIPERLAPFRECMATLREQLPIDRTFLSEKALEDLPGRNILIRADAQLEQLSRDLAEAANKIESALRKTDEGLNGIRNDWLVRKKDVQSAYEKILRELQKSRVDGEEFIRLRRQIEELRPLRDRQGQVRRVEKDLSDRRRALLVEWENLKAEEFRSLAKAASQVNQKLRDRVQVEVTAAGDREPLLQILRSHVGGRLSEATQIIATVRDLSITQFVEACRSGTAALNKLYGITLAQGDRLTKAAPEVLMRMEELELPSTTAIRLNTAPAGDPPAWQSLEQLSTGQKATAVLLLLLLESQAPLIVDQPEDDLDNRFITEGVVPRMREEKQRRQFIFSTHNANIPVLGDAELIVGLSASGEAESGHARILPEHTGSIDALKVRELVEEILEGGKEAFERRRRKYGF
jgi:hypothetical protein